MPEPADNVPVDLARESDFQLGATRVLPASREVVFGDRTETLEPRVMQVLVALAKRRGAVVSREDLSERCWNGRAVGDDALNRCIARLRRLAEAAGEFDVETIPRVGYRLVAEPKTPPPVKKPRRTWLVSLLAVLVLALIAGAFALRHSRHDTASLEGHTFIVIPFVATSDDPASRQLAQGVSASIVDALTREGHRVISPAQAEKFAGVGREHITDATGARFIVNGEVRREGASFRVLARIDDGRAGRTLRSQQFEGDASQPARLADLVAGYVGVRSWSMTPTAIESGHAEVVDAGFRAGDLLAKGESRAAYDLAASMARKYPDDALALLQFSAFSSFNYWALQKDEVAPAMRAARAAATRVTELVPDFGDGYVARATLLPPQRWAQREALMRHGLEIDPDTRFAGHYLSGMLAEVGRVRDAEQLERGEVGRDPFNLEKERRHFDLLSLLGNRTEAAGVLEFGERYVPGDAEFAVHRFMASDLRGAAADAARLMADPATAAILEPAERAPRIRTLLRALESRRAADIEAAVAVCTPDWVSAQTTAVCLAGLSALGRLDDAFAFAAAIYPDQRAATEALEDELWLRRERSFTDTTLLYRAELAPLRADARFIALAERIRLLDYWRAGHPPDFCATEHVPVCDAIGKSSALNR